MKKNLMVLLAGFLTASIALAQGTPECGKALTYPQLANLLVEALGLAEYLPATPTTQQLFDILMQNGIAPAAGWTMDEEASVRKGDWIRVLVQAMQRDDEVENPDDPQSWVEVLTAMGINFNNVSEALGLLAPLPKVVASDIGFTNTDSLPHDIRVDATPMGRTGGGDGNNIRSRAEIAVGCILGAVLAWQLSRYLRRRRRGYDVFISSRRESGAEIARALQLALKNLGYRVFFDFNSLQDGKFNEKIFNAIQTAKYFVLVLTDGALDRCANGGDWVRTEIERALSLRKPIVPVCPTGHNRAFPEALPVALESLRNIQISELNMETLFEESIRKIAKQRLLR